MKIVALALAAVSLVSASPVLASPPPTKPVVYYYVIDGRTRLSGQFATYYACNAQLRMLEKLRGAQIFCASNWIAR